MDCILVVDDLKENQYLLETLLASEGYQVVTAGNGVEALAIARQNPPALIISDILMPQMDGYAFCRECKRDSLLREIPFVFLTATYTEPQDEDLARRLGALAFIPRPIENADLAGEIHNLLEQHRAGAIPTPEIDFEEETTYYRLYNEVLIHKLEAKMLELEETHQTLQAKSEEMNRYFEASLDLLCIADKTGQLGRINPAWENTLGYSREEMEGNQLTDFVHPEDQDATRDVFQHLLNNGEIRDFQNRFIHKDGTFHWLEWHAYSQDGRIYAVARDITQRKRIEQNQQRMAAHIYDQAQEMEQILATVPAGVLLLNDAGRILHANRAARDALTVLTDDTTDDIITRLGTLSLAELKAAPYSGIWHEVSYEHRVFEVTARHMGSSTPGISKWVLLINDVTQTREIQEQLHHQARLATVGQLAAGIAHDFNNIMAAIGLHAQTIGMSPNLSERNHQRLQTINEQTRHAANLIDQILDFSRHSVMERTALDLIPLVKEWLKFMERILPTNISLTFEYDEREAVVEVDPTRIQQVLMNLAINARDAMPNGGELVLSLRHFRLDGEMPAPFLDNKGRGYLTIAISDTGVGIAPENLSRLFDPFFTTKPVGQGTGLGLAQVYGLVQQHDGHITVDSAVGSGSTFTVYLPLASRPTKEQMETPTPESNKGTETILLVEDAEITREAVKETLEYWGYQVLTAANGLEGLAVLEEFHDRIALVLSDLVMPEMDGLEFFSALRKRWPQMKFLMMTGHAPDDTGRQLLERGLVEWIPKTKLIDLLGSRVRTLLEQSNGD